MKTQSTDFMRENSNSSRACMAHKRKKQEKGTIVSRQLMKINPDTISS